MTAGPQRERIAFDKRDQSSDGGGGITTAFSEQFVLWASYTHLRGGETVIAGRLEGKHPAIIRVRASVNSRLIGTDWRARDERAGTTYAIRDVTWTPDRKWIDLLCESGVAA